MNEKRILGQYFTKENVWLKPQILDFIKSSNCSVVYDPFAGGGDILKAIAKTDTKLEVMGLDIDSKLGWKSNDSLLHIPHIDNAIIVTNPPYLTNYSAARKGLLSERLIRYFNDNPSYSDVYLIALEKMLDAQDYVVAIIPETFINSNFKKKNLLHSITVLEENPFTDTQTPVLVACFDSKKKSLKDIKVYCNDRFVNYLGIIENLRLVPRNTIEMKFNDIDGWLGVRCVDATDPNNMLKFDKKEHFNYDWDSNIKISSRLLTLISIDIPTEQREVFVEECNRILLNLRSETDDIIFSPFKGNMKNGRRRRRLDFKSCRAIIEKAYNNIYQQERENAA